MSKQGDLSLLEDPVAQELLQSTHLARLAYIWTDGTPRVVPVWFHWDGRDLVIAGPPNAPKMKALPRNSNVAVTIDREDPPYHALFIRGTATTTVTDGAPPEYAAAARRYMGQEAGDAWVAGVNQMAPQSARIAIRPEWVGLIDFERRFPSAIEEQMLAAVAGGNK
jgi:PPOX class probable F420-dependent enzyme